VSRSSNRNGPTKGLVFPLRTTVKGRVRWQVLDERGVPEVPRTPSGFAIGPAEGITQDNLITNFGMDQIAIDRLLENIINTDPGEQSSLRHGLAVGTGSTVPAFTDTVLDAEVQRASSTGGFASTEVQEYDSVAEEFRGIYTTPRVVTMSADRNLTEFGFYGKFSTASMSIRELLRDGGGTPVPVSLLTGKMLRLDHEITQFVPAPTAGTAGTLTVETYDAGNVLVSSVDFDYLMGPFANTLTGNSTAIRDMLEGTYSPSSTTLARGLSPMVAAKAYAVTHGSYTFPSGSLTIDTYVPGSYERIARRLVPVASQNGPIYGMVAVNNQSLQYQGGWMASFTSPASFTKLDTQELRIAMKLTWARA